MSALQLTTHYKNKKIKFLTKNIEIQNEIMENQIEKQNIGMSVDIDIEVTENEIKNEKCINRKRNQNEIKISA